MDDLDAKKGSGSAYPVQHVSNRRLVTEGEKEKALQMAHAASTKDSIIVVMRLSHVYRGFYMVTCHLVPKSDHNLNLPLFLFLLPLFSLQLCKNLKLRVARYGLKMKGLDIIINENITNLDLICSLHISFNIEN